MKIFMTGGTGFIGSYFINEAFKKKFDIFCIKRNNSLPRIKLKKDPIWILPSNKDDIFNKMRKSELFFHFASHGVSPQKSNWSDLINYNIIESFNLVKLAKEAGIKKIVLIGTYQELGRNAYISEPNHNIKLIPENPYASSKAAFLSLMYSFSNIEKLKIIYFRIANAYGIGQFKNNLWISLKNAAKKGNDFVIKNGELKKSFISVSQVVKSLINNLKFNEMEYGDLMEISIRNAKEQSVAEFASFWWDKWNAKGKLIFI